MSVYKKKTAEEKAALRKEKQYESDVELQAAIDDYFLKNSGVKLNEFSLAKHLGITSVRLRQMKADGERPERQYLIQAAYDRITDAVISDPEWNDKFMQQKAKQILESPQLAGYNTKMDVKSDNTVKIIFGEGADSECMK
jgi:hypothetical protein